MSHQTDLVGEVIIHHDNISVTRNSRHTFGNHIVSLKRNIWRTFPRPNLKLVPTPTQILKFISRYVSIFSNLSRGISTMNYHNKGGRHRGGRDEVVTHTNRETDILHSSLKIPIKDGRR